MEEIGSEKRVSVYFSGTVQGVGFRYATRRLAEGYEVTGFVRNLDDGRVEMVAEGRELEIQRFIAAIRQEMGGYVTKLEQTAGPAEGNFQGFGIRF